MKRYYRTRTTYAPAHRTSTPRTAGVYITDAGEGIRSQTCDGARQGFTQPIEVGKRADGTPLYFVQSEVFPDRYYGLYRQQDGSWFFSGDAKLAAKYIAKVEEFISSHQLLAVA